MLPAVSPLSRAIGIELLGFQLGDEGRRALDDLVIEPKVGAVIAARLSRDDRQPATEEIGWVLVDMAAALLEFGGEPSEVVESVAVRHGDGRAGEHDHAAGALRPPGHRARAAGVHRLPPGRGGGRRRPQGAAPPARPRRGPRVRGRG
ncbi:hypothetical protein ACFSTC_30445 [Nonomuraea ferruginea]